MDSAAVTALSCFGGLPPASTLYTRKAVDARLLSANSASSILGQKAVCFVSIRQKCAANPPATTGKMYEVKDQSSMLHA
jgi:hypothetical protein